MSRSQFLVSLLAIVTSFFATSVARAADFYGAEELAILKQLSSFHRSGKTNVMPSATDAIQLDRFVQTGPEDIGPAVRLHLMATALGVLSDKSNSITWQVAKAEGKPDLFDVWFSEAIRELPKHEFPFSTKDLTKLRPTSNDFVTNLQIDEQLKWQFGGMFTALGNKKLQSLRDGLKTRAEARQISKADPVADQRLLCEVIEDGAIEFNRITNRGPTELRNLVIIAHLDVDAPEVKIHPNYRTLSALNSGVNAITGIGNARSQNDQGAANLVYMQWYEAFDQWTMNVIPKLGARQSVLLPIAPSGRLQYGKRLQAVVFGEDFWMEDLPVLKLADYQKKRVQQETRRGATWLNGDKPHVVADEQFEKDFAKRRTEAAKNKMSAKSK